MFGLNNPVQKAHATPLKQAKVANSVLWCSKGTEACIGLALLIIACLTVTGVMSGVVAGGTIVGLAGVTFMLKVAKAIFAKSKADRYAAIAGSVLVLALAVLGTLSLVGVIPASIAAYTILGAAAASIMIDCCLGCVTARQALKEHNDGHYQEVGNRGQ
jgi:hypothetical protein